MLARRFARIAAGDHVGAAYDKAAVNVGIFGAYAHMTTCACAGHRMYTCARIVGSSIQCKEAHTNSHLVTTRRQLHADTNNPLYMSTIDCMCECARVDCHHAPVDYSNDDNDDEEEGRGCDVAPERRRVELMHEVTSHTARVQHDLPSRPHTCRLFSHCANAVCVRAVQLGYECLQKSKETLGAFVHDFLGTYLEENMCVLGARQHVLCTH